MILIIVCSVVSLGWGAIDDNGLWGFATLMSSLVSIVMLILSGIAPIGNDLVEVKPATNTRVGNELMIQTQGWPTQVITDIKFIDKPVLVKKVIEQNAWGGDLLTTYIIEESKIENPN